MKLTGKSIPAAEFYLTLNSSEAEMLLKLSSYGIAVAEPIIGKEAPSDRKEAWDKFLTSMRASLAPAIDRWRDSQSVFRGEMDAQRAVVKAEPL